MKKRLLVLYLNIGAMMLTLSSAWAGIEANMEMRFLQKQNSDAAQKYLQNAKIYLETDYYRSDMGQGTEQNASYIVDRKAKKAYMLMHSSKKYTEMDLSAVDKENLMASFENRDFEKALRAQGWKVKKTGQETLGGYRCDIYEMEKDQDGSKVQMKSWISKAFGADVPFALKTIVSQNGQATTEVIMKNIEKKKLAATLFKVPVGYTPMSMPKTEVDMNRKLQDFQKLTPEEQRREIEKLKREYGAPAKP